MTLEKFYDLLYEQDGLIGQFNHPSKNSLVGKKLRIILKEYVILKINKKRFKFLLEPLFC